MTTTAYEALAAKLVKVTAERDRARGWAVALEQQVAAVGALAAEWQSEVDHGRILSPDARYCWGIAALEVRVVLNPERVS